MEEKEATFLDEGKTEVEQSNEVDMFLDGTKMK